MLLPKDECIWLEYATYDENGFVNGIDPDAPEEVKKAYEEHLKKRQEWKSQWTKK